jgi:tRNA uridine 5-carbamoylmethylation protein Kti12
MITNDQNQLSLIGQTVNTFDGNIDSTTATDGLSVIDKWLNRLDEVGDDITDDIADTLERLRAEVDTAQRYNRPDNQQIANLLQELIDQTRNVATSADASAEQIELSQLIATLENLHRQAVNLVA